MVVKDVWLYVVTVMVPELCLDECDREPVLYNTVQEVETCTGKQRLPIMVT